MRQKFFDSDWRLLIIFCIPFILLALMIWNSRGTTSETYRASCEVIDKKDTQYDTNNLALDNLMGMPQGTFKMRGTHYIVVVEYEENLYDVQVDEEFYNEIQIGEILECEIVYVSNERNKEYSYQVSILEAE